MLNWIWQCSEQACWDGRLWTNRKRKVVPQASPDLTLNVWCIKYISWREYTIQFHFVVLLVMHQWYIEKQHPTMVAVLGYWYFIILMCLKWAINILVLFWSHLQTVQEENPIWIPVCKELLMIYNGLSAVLAILQCFDFGVTSKKFYSAPNPHIQLWCLEVNVLFILPHYLVTLFNVNGILKTMIVTTYWVLWCNRRVLSSHWIHR